MLAFPQSERILRGGVQVRESATYFSRPTPTLPFANDSMPALSPVMLVAAKLHLLLHYLVPGDRWRDWET